MASNEFILVGAAGYIAPRHMAAIQSTGSELIYACDTSDSVGVLDRYFPNCKFVLSMEELDKALQDPTLCNVKNSSLGSRFLTICTPNYLHVPHISFGLSHGFNVICEKPLALTTNDLLEIERLERKYARKVYCILQLRLHPHIHELKKKLDGQFADEELKEKLKVSLTYVTSRGPWYKKSWKYDVRKAGGIETNIGIHFFDMLIELFGFPSSYSIGEKTSERLQGSLITPRAEVDFFLSIKKEDLPEKTREAGEVSYREMTLNGHSVDFTKGFTDLHTKSYEEILAGRGFGLEDAWATVSLCESIRLGHNLGEIYEK
ncbi:Gfo/Idh/MocA family protein [Turicimonas muris]|uniref:Gfo/Idh/MocA family protein n=1 Tax=Turicimonas muris TaxID=1796652 RepID=UPI00263ACCCC|nr:Gfo/Idh/MocA family oxidoreductase [Turicimonas muris]